MTGDSALLCHAPQGLVQHVVQLLADASIAAEVRPSGDHPNAPSPVLVPSVDLDKARSVIGLVLPQLLEADSSSSGLSDQLVRSDEPEIKPLPVWRGPRSSVLDAASDEFHDDEGDFKAPPPPPVPRPRDRVARFAWAAAIGGPILLLIAILAGLSGAVALTAMAAFFVGFGVLVLRSPGSRHPDDPGNGAIL